MSSFPCYLENAEQMLSEGKVRAAAQYLLCACRDTGFSEDGRCLASLLRTPLGYAISRKSVRPILDRLKAATISELTG